MPLRRYPKKLEVQTGFPCKFCRYRSLYFQIFFHVFLFLTSSSVSRFPGLYAVRMIASVNRFTHLSDIHHRRSLPSRRF